MVIEWSLSESGKWTWVTICNYIDTFVSVVKGYH